MQEENPVLDIRLISGFLLVRINNEENKEEVKKVVDKSPKFVGGRWLELQDNLEMRRRGFVGKRGKIVSVDSEAKKSNDHA